MSVSDELPRHGDVSRMPISNAEAGGPELDLERLAGGATGLTPTQGAYMAEAAAVCLSRKHPPPVTELRVRGDLVGAHALRFRTLTTNAQAAWGDLDDAVESGACGVAIVLLLARDKSSTVLRSSKGGGFDFWVGPGPDFQDAARLEVSGILSGPARVEGRVQEKVKQIRRDVSSAAPRWVAVVEFSEPGAKVVRA